MSIDLNLYLWRPALPRPPCLPAPRPALMPRPWVRLPRNLRVRLGIFSHHPLHEVVDRAAPVSEGTAPGVRLLRGPPPALRGRESEERSEPGGRLKTVLRDPRRQGAEVLRPARFGEMFGREGGPRVGHAPVFEQEAHDLRVGLPPGDVP